MGQLLTHVRIVWPTTLPTLSKEHLNCGTSYHRTIRGTSYLVPPSTSVSLSAQINPLAKQVHQQRTGWCCFSHNKPKIMAVYKLLLIPAQPRPRNFSRTLYKRTVPSSVHICVHFLASLPPPFKAVCLPTKGPQGCVVQNIAITWKCAEFQPEFPACTLSCWLFIRELVYTMVQLRQHRRIAVRKTCQLQCTPIWRQSSNQAACRVV